MRETNILDGIKIVKENLDKLTDKLLADFFTAALNELMSRKILPEDSLQKDPREVVKEKEVLERKTAKCQKKQQSK